MIEVQLQDSLGNDRQIAESAWTSSTSQQNKSLKTDSDVKRIVNMLADSKHSTPFESIIFRFWIRMPVFTDRQFMTHRLQSASGLSGRYRTLPKDFFSIPSDVKDILIKAKQEYLEQEYIDACENAIENYTEGLCSLKTAEKQGIITNEEYKRAREILRGQVPVSNMTERVTVMNLRSFANFYKLRASKDAQKEIQFVAQEMLKQIKEKNVCPEAISALERNNWII